MKRHHLTCALACLLAGAATHAAAQNASAGVADPQAPTPATRAQPAIDYRTAPPAAARPDEAWRAANATVGGRNPMRLTMPGMQGGHDHHAGMDMGATPAPTGMQCMAGGGCACCGGKDKMPAHDDHAGMQCMAGGGCACCADKDKMPARGDHDNHGAMQCKPADGGCGCCNGMAMKDGADCCDHKEGM
jgi:hypothetical protein